MKKINKNEMQINAEGKQLKFQMLAGEQSYENNVQSSTS